MTSDTKTSTELSEFLILFMMLSDDRRSETGLHFMPLSPVKRLTHRGLHNAALHAYTSAMEIKEYKKSISKHISNHAEGFQYKDAKLEGKIFSGLFNPEIYLNAFRGLLKVDRSLFTNPGGELKEQDYFNIPISIQNGQTCSAPYMVLMYNLVAASLLKNPQVIGEGGTGCGYHVANTGIVFPNAKIYTWEDSRRECNSSFTQALSVTDSRQGTNLSKRIIPVKKNCFDLDRFKDLPGGFDAFYFTFRVPGEGLLEQYFNRLKEGGIIIAPIRSNPMPGASNLRVYLKEKNEIRRSDICGVSFTEALMPRQN